MKIDDSLEKVFPGTFEVIPNGTDGASMILDYYPVWVYPYLYNVTVEEMGPQQIRPLKIEIFEKVRDLINTNGRAIAISPTDIIIEAKEEVGTIINSTFKTILYGMRDPRTGEMTLGGLKKYFMYISKENMSFGFRLCDPRSIYPIRTMRLMLTGISGDMNDGKVVKNGEISLHFKLLTD